MTDSGTDFEREEAAFRAGFARHAGHVEPASFRTPRRHWGAPLLIAALVLAVLATAVGIAGTRGDEPDAPPVDVPRLENAQWIGVRNIEVQAPADWPALYEPTRPDCIKVETNDRVEPGLATRGYVVIGVPDRIIVTIGCFRAHGPGDPDAAFGDLPFPLWRPYVKVVPARPDMAGGSSEYRDGSWEFRGWRLTRRTFDDVQVSVLSAPGDDAFGPMVMSSARRVTSSRLGCPVESAVLDHPDVDARPLPAPEEVTGVVVCDYARDPRGQGLAGSRELTGNAATDLVAAIEDAPSVPAADRQNTCRYRTNRAMALLFRGENGHLITSAFIYVDSCGENGIVAPGLGTRALTRGNCAPLFREPPIGLFSFSTVDVVHACATRQDDDQYVVPDPFR